MSDDKDYQIRKLSGALEVSNRTIQALETRVKDARALIELYEKEKKQAVQQQKMQQDVIKQQLAASDAKVQELQNEILQLRAELKAKAA